MSEVAGMAYFANIVTLDILKQIQGADAATKAEQRHSLDRFTKQFNLFEQECSPEQFLAEAKKDLGIR
jgi:hypothetical protein